MRNAGMTVEVSVPRDQIELLDGLHKDISICLQTILSAANLPDDVFHSEIEGQLGKATQFKLMFGVAVVSLGANLAGLILEFRKAPSEADFKAKAKSIVQVEQQEKNTSEPKALLEQSVRILIKDKADQRNITVEVKFEFAVQ